MTAPGVAHAARPGGGDGDPGGPAGGGSDGSDPTGGGGGDPAAGGVTGGTAAHKNIIRLPGLKIEIKNTVGDYKPPTIKFVPSPCLTRR